MNSVVARIGRLQHVGEMAAVDVGHELAARARRAVKARSACTAMAGPRSEPPMPMLTTSVKGFCALPTIAPPRTPSANASMRSRSLMTVLLDLGAADAGARRLAQRHVQHRAILGGVDLLAAPHRIDALAQPDGVGELQRACRARSRRGAAARSPCSRPDRLAREALEAARVAREQLVRRARCQTLRRGR